MRIVSAEAVDQALTFPDLVEALREAFRGEMVAPPRHHHAIGEGAEHATCLIMPAWTGGAPRPGAFLGTKIVNVFPGNGGLGLPAVLGTYILMSGESGAPLAAIDGTRLTYWRTAAASALAASYLAREDAARLCMVGAGALAPYLIRAHASQRPIRTVSIWNHRAERAEALALAMRREGFAAEPVADLGAAVASADIVSCATLSSQPLVEGGGCGPAPISTSSAPSHLAMREADDAALARASVFVDTEAALTEGGDVALAIAGGAIERSHVRATLYDLARARRRGRAAAEEITLFKSVGSAIEDLAAAMLVWRSIAS